MVIDKKKKVSIQTGRLEDVYTYRCCPIKVWNTENPKMKTMCIGPNCAWFDFDNDACAVLGLVRVLDALYEWESSRS